ncbi:MAG TPA: cytochrome c peroxidase [Rhodoblastus sp.]|nr:cytochrome c peroxidase [Rhodoblastus sp.]
MRLWRALLAVVLFALPGRAQEAARPTPLGLPPVPGPASDPAAAALGKKLFFDLRLSFNGTMSCGMCHLEGHAFTDNELETSVGMEGKSLRRNAPSLFNVVYEQSLFRDGRESALETQVWSPILSPDEMAAPSVGWEIDRIRAIPDYRASFDRVFPGKGVSMDTIGAAIAAYERSLLLANSRFDQWKYGGNGAALTGEEIEGYRLFVGKADCVACHAIGEQDALFTDHAFHDTGIAYPATVGRRDTRFQVRLAEGVFTHRTDDDIRMVTRTDINDLGRFEVTQDPKDRWAFKTPSLRNVALTGPYMHDGSLHSLEDVVDYYNRGGDDSPNKSPLIHALGLSAAEKGALVAFLKSLTGSAP